MTSKETNPFVLKDYLVAESPISNPSQYSQIVSANNVSEMTKAGYKILQPMNILELEQYLATEINKFLMNVRFARTCDNYVVQGLSLPTKCTNTFKNYGQSTNVSQFGTGDSLLNGLVYTDSYISLQTRDNDKKSLSQRLSDLQSMLSTFQYILNNIDTLKSKYPDQYNNIMQKYNQNVSMRTILDQKLDNIYSNESSYGNSKRFLDSTVYTSVLWTILATTIVFYIFKKM